MISTNQISKSTLSKFYLLGYLFLLISSFIEMINLYGNLRTFLIRPVMIICIISGIFINILILSVNYNNQQIFKWGILFLILIVLLYEYFSNVSIVPIRLVTLLILLLNVNVVNIHQFINYDVVCKIISFIIISIFSYIGIIPILIGSKGVNFGFTNSNVAGGVILSIVMSLFILLDYNKYINIKIIISLSFILIIVFGYLTKCRGLECSGIFCIIFILLYKFYPVRNFLCKHATIISLTIFILFMLLVYKFNIDNGFLNKINKLLSSRPLMQSLIIQVEPLKLVGQPIRLYLVNGFNLSYFDLPFLTVDNSYLAIAYHYGIIGIVCVEFIFLSIIRVSGKYKEYIPCVLLISLALYAGIESSFLSVFLTFPMLYSVALKDNKDVIGRK